MSWSIAHHVNTTSHSNAEPEAPERRDFLAKLSALAMAGGLVAGYGTFASFAARYLYPSGATAKGWMFVSTVQDFPMGSAKEFRTPTGAGVTIARQQAQGSVEDFIALSSVCPHLGCKVHWEAQNDRFYCPCHNGVFNPSGLGTEGPPKGQSLGRYPLLIENGLLFIEVELEGLSASEVAGPQELS